MQLSGLHEWLALAPRNGHHCAVRAGQEANSAERSTQPTSEGIRHALPRGASVGRMVVQLVVCAGHCNALRNPILGCERSL